MTNLHSWCSYLFRYFWYSYCVQDNGCTLFCEGNQVEVSGKYFGASWSPATVLKVIGATNFLVKYMHNGKDGKSATEILNSQYIRPARAITRIDSKYRFSPSSHVEVLYEGSWWPGVILNVLGTGIDKKYAVMLDSHKTDLDDIDHMDALRVEITQLRPLCDWDGEKWVPCLKKVHLHILCFVFCHSFPWWSIECYLVPSLHVLHSVLRCVFVQGAGGPQPATVGCSNYIKLNFSALDFKEIYQYYHALAPHHYIVCSMPLLCLTFIGPCFHQG